MTKKHECGLDVTCCDQCGSEMEVGQVGLCDACQAPKAEAAAPMRFYSVIGRICGDDEDTALCFEAACHQDAIDLFKQEILQRRWGGGFAYEVEVFVSHVVWSKTRIYDWDEKEQA